MKISKKILEDTWASIDPASKSPAAKSGFERLMRTIDAVGFDEMKKQAGPQLESLLTQLKADALKNPAPKGKGKPKRETAKRLRESMGPQPDQGAELSTALGLMKRFVGMHGKERTGKQAMALLKAVKRAVLLKHVRFSVKPTPLQKEVKHIQKSLLALFDGQLDPGDGKTRKEIDFNERIVGLFRTVLKHKGPDPGTDEAFAFLRMEGTAPPVGKAARLLKEFERLLWDHEVQLSVQMGVLIARMMGSLDRYINGQSPRVEINETVLEGPRRRRPPERGRAWDGGQTRTDKARHPLLTGKEGRTFKARQEQEAPQMNAHRVNQEIEALVARKDADQEAYTQAEKEFILRYSGAGGKGGAGAKGEGLLYEFYTPDYIVGHMWRIASALGYDGGPVLEPAAGTGVFARMAPAPSMVVGFEPNPVSRRIAEITCPEATFHGGYFETAFLERPRFTSRVKGGCTWLEGFPFSLVIGNPPYGAHRNLYSGYFKQEGMPSLEAFFMLKGLEVLRPGGLLMYVIPSAFMRNGATYDRVKERLGGMAELVHALRLPSVFESSAIPTDIIILKRK